MKCKAFVGDMVPWTWNHSIGCLSVLIVRGHRFFANGYISFKDTGWVA